MCWTSIELLGVPSNSTDVCYKTTNTLPLLILESVYQEHVTKVLTEKYGTLSAQVDKIVHDANSEISNLRSQMLRKIAGYCLRLISVNTQMRHDH